MFDALLRRPSHVPFQDYFDLTSAVDAVDLDTHATGDVVSGDDVLDDVDPDTAGLSLAEKIRFHADTHTKEKAPGKFRKLGNKWATKLRKQKKDSPEDDVPDDTAAKRGSWALPSDDESDASDELPRHSVSDVGRRMT